MTASSVSWLKSLEDALTCGMALAHFAARRPHAMAVQSPFGARSFAELNANANRLARLFRASGMAPGDAVAVVSRNRPAFVETYFAALRSGMRFTPVNFHLTGEEAGYVIDNCEARLVVYDGELATAFANEGPRRQWRRFGARGRFKPWVHRTSHVTVILSERTNLPVVAAALV